MLTFLFWNINGKPLQRTIGNLVRRHNVDIVILAESPIAEEKIIREVNRGASQSWQHLRRSTPDPLCHRLAIFVRFPSEYLLLKGGRHHYTLRLLRIPGKDEIILGAIHYASKRYRSAESQSMGIPGISDAICDLERQERHSRTLLVGDLNMNPFDLGVVGAEGLNAVMTQEIALREKRIIDQIARPFF